MKAKSTLILAVLGAAIGSANSAQDVLTDVPLEVTQ
jgi:hypothetical protein